MHTSQHYQGTVNPHSKKGKQFIAELRQEVKAYNKGARTKLRVALFGRGPRQEIAQKMGKPLNYYYFRHPPLRHCVVADVYIYNQY